MPDFLTHQSTQIAYQHNLDIRHWYAILTGLTCGIGSALTGTGGPLLLMPILVFTEIPTLHALGLAQVMQIPIATMATASNLRPVKPLSNWDWFLLYCLASVRFQNCISTPRSRHQDHGRGNCDCNRAVPRLSNIVCCLQAFIYILIYCFNKNIIY